MFDKGSAVCTVLRGRDRADSIEHKVSSAAISIVVMLFSFTTHMSYISVVPNGKTRTSYVFFRIRAFSCHSSNLTSSIMLYDLFIVRRTICLFLTLTSTGINNHKMYTILTVHKQTSS